MNEKLNVTLISAAKVDGVRHPAGMILPVSPAIALQLAEAGVIAEAQTDLEIFVPPASIEEQIGEVVEDYEAEIAKLVEAHDAQVAELTAARDGASHELNVVKAERDGLTQQLTDMTARAGSAEAQVQTLEARVLELQNAQKQGEPVEQTDEETGQKDETSTSSKKKG